MQKQDDLVVTVQSFDCSDLFGLSIVPESAHFAVYFSPKFLVSAIF
jgi:hypothetical protein